MLRWGILDIKAEADPMPLYHKEQTNVKNEADRRGGQESEGE